MQLSNHMDPINKLATSPELTDQDKNWELMSVLGMKWSETKELSEEDKNFLLSKVERIKVHIEQENNRRY